MKKERLKELRIKNGYTSNFVANYLNIKRNTLYLKENGQRNFNLQEVKKLCELYDVSIQQVDV